MRHSPARPAPRLCGLATGDSEGVEFSTFRVLPGTVRPCSLTVGSRRSDWAHNGPTGSLPVIYAELNCSLLGLFRSRGA